MHANLDLRVVLKWVVAGSGSSNEGCLKEENSTHRQQINLQTCLRSALDRRIDLLGSLA